MLSLLILGWLFWTADIDAVKDAFTRADLGELTAWLAVFSVIVFVADSATLFLLFRRVLTPVRYMDVLAVKGVSYFVNVLNYSAATGMIAFFVHKKKNVSFLVCFSSLLWLNFVDVIALLSLLAFGMLFGGHLIPPEIYAQLPLLTGVGWLLVVGALTYWLGGFDWFFLGRMRDWRIFRAFARAKVADYVLLVSARMGFVMIYVLMHLAILPTFDIHVGLLALLVYTPITTFVQIIPANVSGLGAITVVMIAMYAAHVSPDISDPEAQVLAMATFIGPTNTLLRLLLGYAFVANVAKDFLPSSEAIEAARRDDAGEAP